MPLSTKSTTAGRLLIQKALPEKYHQYVQKGLDKEQLEKLFSTLAQEDSDKYEEILRKLSRYGERIGSTYGDDGSLTPESLIPSKELKIERAKLRKEIDSIKKSDLPLKQQDDMIIASLSEGRDRLKEKVEESIQGTAFGTQMKSGVRGNIDQITDILVGEILPVDSNSAPIPFPVTRGYSEGLTPSQYWTTAQRARMGLIGVKLATPEAGDISNQIMQGVQKLRITEDHEPEDSQAGLPVDPTDSDYIGSILAKDVGDIAQKGEKITPRLARRLDDQNIDTVLIHSPITSQVVNGISKDSAGTATGIDFNKGDFAGITAAQSILEPLTQSSIGSKHVGQRSAAGTDLVKLLISVPSDFPQKAPVSEEGGYVKEIKESETGPTKITIGRETYNIPQGEKPSVDKGDKVQRGQVLSSGVPNPADLVEQLGVGEGRKKFAESFSKALKDAGIDHNKRNVEYIARGLVNHARITEPYEEYSPGDIVEFSHLMKKYSPREGYREVDPDSARDKYLEMPIAHYTPGTHINDDMANNLKKLGYKNIPVHDQPPPFRPEMRRGREARKHSENWIERLGGSDLKRSFMKSLQEGRSSADASDPTALMTDLLLQGKPKDPDKPFKNQMFQTLTG